MNPSTSPQPARQDRPRFLDVHVLHSVPTSNLNRDDLGQPKEAVYGGVRRARVSSQCLKRTVRKSLEADQTVEAAVRTKRLPDQTAGLLAGRDGWTAETASIAAVALLDTVGFSPAKGDESLTDMITFLPADAAGRLAGIAESHAGLVLGLIDATIENLDDLKKRLAAAAEIGTALKTRSAEPEAGQKAAQHLAADPARLAEAKEIVAEVKRVLGDRNPMIALMGRMYASQPDSNVDGAVQVAHALTTHAAVNDADYFTTVDDLNPSDETGAGYLDVADYTSGVLYKYATVDLDALTENLAEGPDSGPRPEAELVAAFADRFARVISEAKKRVTAPHTPPSLVLVAARCDAPLSYANAFERPVEAPQGGGYLKASIRRLLAEDADAAETGGISDSWLYVARTATDLPIETQHRRSTLKEIASGVAAHLVEARS